MTNKSFSHYYQLPVVNGLEALDAINYNTPFPFHFHPTFNISLVYEGVFNTKLNDKSVNATKGTILITNPNEIHANPCLTTEGRTFFTFYLTPDFFEYTGLQRGINFKEKVIDNDFLFSQLHRIAVKIKSGYMNNACEKEFTALLKTLALKHSSASDEEPEHWKISSLFEDYLAEDYLEKFSLQEAANRLGVDKYKFLRLFKFQTGLTPNNYLILKRVEKSKKMLLEGQDPLAVAIDLGFYDTAHFYKHFKKFTGTSPVAYKLSV